MLIFCLQCYSQMLKKSLIMLNKCTYNSQYIAHYAQAEPTIMLTKTNNMRHNETQLHYLKCNVNHFSFTMCLDLKMGSS